MTLTEAQIIQRLAGEIEPVGEYCVDEKRATNLKNWMSITSFTISKLIVVAGYADSSQRSCSVVGKMAKQHLENLAKNINYILEED